MVSVKRTLSKKGAASMYVYQLDRHTKTAIEAALVMELMNRGYRGEELAQAIEAGMNSKVSDLHELIDIPDCTA
jgi:hypothetical protein